MTMAEVDAIEKTETAVVVQPPRKFAVVLFNDDFTPMDFVVDLLRHVFRLQEQDAYRVMMEVHNKGKAVAGIYPKEIAESKASRALQLSAHFTHPLYCEVVPLD